jgi:ADP-ribose pyrophosphatase
MTDKNQESPNNQNPHPNRNILAQGKFLRAVAADGWEWVERTNTSGAVVIAAVTEDRRLVLVEQYRIPLAARVIELPAGLTGDTPGTEREPEIDAARRELLEETGFEADDWQFLIDGPSSAGLAAEVYSLFLARNARRVGPGGGDHDEDILVHVVPLGEVEAWLQAKRESGILVDPKIFAGVYFAEKRR